MPPESALRGIPTVLTTPSEGEASVAMTLIRGEDTPAPGTGSPGGSVTALLTNLLPQTKMGPASGAQGVYVGEGLLVKLATKIQRSAYVDMGELLPELWGSTNEKDQPKQEAKVRWARSVQDIFTWLQCYGMYVSVLAPQHPSQIPELMAYQATIVQASQDYAGLAWVQYASAFRREAALTGLTQWSAINPTLYTLCFTGSARTATQCELCFAAMHTTKECAQQGDPDPGVWDRLRAIERAVLLLNPQPRQTLTPPPRAAGRQQAPSGEVCRNWNMN